jgi:putative ABC transport system permease protein
MSWRQQISKIGALFRRRKPVDDLAEEIRSHLEMEEQENLESGMPPAEAHYAALRRFGNVTSTQERSREMWGWNWLDTLLQDVRYGLRMLVKNPGFTAVAVVTLALGIGVNTTIFSLVNTVVLHPLPYPHAERLVGIESRRPASVYAEVQEGIQKQGRTFDSFGGCSFDPSNVMWNSAGNATRLKEVDVSPEVFAVLGVPPLLGRTFLPEETIPGGGQVVVLSYAAWRKYFASDRGVIGKTINLNGKIHTVVGVMPPTFSFPSRQVDVWLPPSSPLSMASKGSVGMMIAVGRLRPGVSAREAQAELNVIAEHLGWQSLTGEKLDLRVASLQEQTAGPVTRKALWILLGAVGIVLLLACSNIANLLIARNARRQREIAVCAALGASRPRLVRQLVTESLLLALLGGCLGLLAALGGIHLVRVLAPPRLLFVQDVSINGFVLAFTLVVSLLTGIAFGILPAFAASKPDLIESLKEGSTGSRAARGPALLPKTQGVLTACQVALATILLIGAVLVARSLSRLTSLRLGFDPQHLLVVELNDHDTAGIGRDAWMLFHQRVLDDVKALPGVKSAALVSDTPSMTKGGLLTLIYREGESVPSSPQGALQREWDLFSAGDPRTHMAHIQFVSPGYFTTMKLAILRGRAFTADDRYGSPPVAIVNETLARRLWPNGDALGRKMHVEWRKEQWCEIVGVADVARDISLEIEQPGPEVYRPNLQAREPEHALVVRTIVPPQRLGGAILDRISSASPDQGVDSVMTMDEVLSQSVIAPRFHAALFSFFAFLALLMASVGVYGVVSYSVSQRTHEIGIRMALGAKASDILRLVIGQQMLMTVLGVVIGLGVALGLTRLISSLLYGVAPNDLRTFVGVPILLGLAALAASYIPARRALGVDPLNALRQE